MDRTSKIVVATALAVLVWSLVSQNSAMQKARQAQEVAAAAQKAAEQKVAEVHVAPKPLSEAVAPVAKASGVEADVPEQGEVIKRGEVEWHFTNKGGGIGKIVLLKHKGEGDRPVVLNEFGNVPVGALTESFDAPVLDLFSLEKDPAGRAVTFRRTDVRQLEITKTFTLQDSTSKKADEFIADLEIRIRNASVGPLTVPNYAIRTGAASPLHVKDLAIYTGFNRMKGGSAHFTDATWFAGGGFLGFGKKDRSVYSDAGSEGEPITWLGVNDQYYTMILTSVGAGFREALARRFQISAEEWSAAEKARADEALPFAVEGAGRLAVTTLEPGKEVVCKFSIYAGPREQGLLKSLGGGQVQIMDFGMFSLVSSSLLGAMNLLHGMLGSYAAAIILLTVIIKLLLWPLQNKATDSMKKMQALQPKMNEIKTRYQDNPQRMQQELLSLYRENKVNPMSGCLPMLVQIPIFFGFYNMLGKAVELRNSSFLWVKDLSQPDTVAMIAGYPLNVLPLLMAGTMLWQMQVTPKTGDPVQQRMFMFMPLIFIAFCYNFASALALYWTVQNIFSVVQITITNRRDRVGAQSTVYAPKPRK